MGFGGEVDEGALGAVKGERVSERERERWEKDEPSDEMNALYASRAIRVGQSRATEEEGPELGFGRVGRNVYSAKQSASHSA